MVADRFARFIRAETGRGGGFEDALRCSEYKDRQISEDFWTSSSKRPAK
jgi:hypothetical protein